MKEILGHNTAEIALIKLKGDPYQRTVEGENIDCSSVLEELAVNSDYESRLDENIQRNREHLGPLYEGGSPEGGFYGIDKKLKKGESLTYDEAFSLMTFVSMGVNGPVQSRIAPSLYRDSGLPPEARQKLTSPETLLFQSIGLLYGMSVKESFVGLSAEEIAGLTAAALEIDTIVRIPVRGKVFGFGGMGGDTGYEIDKETSKLFSLSTLGAIALANFGYVHKHHSYPNTSKVAGQSAIESFGARSDQSTPEQFIEMQEATGLLMTSCHTTRLIHTLSHRLKGETINHIVGPLAIPIDRNAEVNAFIGANDNVHPETIIKALKIMQEQGVQNYSNSVAFCGLNEDNPPEALFNETEYYTDKKAKRAVAIDEVAPPPYKTLAAFLIEGKNKGAFLIEPSDFMNEDRLEKINLKKLLIPNTEGAIKSANESALKGADESKALYLAMTVALALFTREYASLPGALDDKARRVNPEFLHEAFDRAYNIITLGEAQKKLQQYVEASKMVLR